MSLTPLLDSGYTLHLAAVVCYSLSYDSERINSNFIVAQIAADRALKARLARIEQFSEDGLPYSGINMRSSDNVDLFKLYLPQPVPLLIPELNYVKLIAVSLANLARTQASNQKMKDYTAKFGMANSKQASKETFNYIIRLVLSMTYEPSLEELHA